MPCSDQTERLTLELDDQDRIRGFSVYKMTCRQPVGGSELLPVVRDMPARSLLSAPAGDLIDPRLDDVQAFMLTKQLVALQGAIAVLYGLPEDGLPEDGLSEDGLPEDGLPEDGRPEDGRPEDGRPQAFDLHELQHDRDGTRLAGAIAINVIAERIASCGGCRCSL